MWYGSYLPVVAMMVGLCLLGRPSAQYSIHLSSYQDICLKANGSASIYFLSQAWQAHIFKKNLRPSAVSTFLLHIPSSEGPECGRTTIYLSSQGWQAHLFKKKLGPGNVSTALLLAFLFSLLIVIFLKALNVVGLVPICRCKGGKFMSFRGAFGLVHLSFTLSSSEGCTFDRTSTCLSLQGWQAHIFKEGLRPGTVSTSLLQTVFFTRL